MRGTDNFPGSVMMEQPTPDQMLDWLERMANERGGLLLHSEYGPTGRTGLGLANTGRTLRQAVAQAMGYRQTEPQDLRV